MKIRSILLITAISTLFISCSKNENNITDNCDLDVIISTDEYNNASSDYVVINSIVLKGDCLCVNFSASGCDGQSWEIKLIDSGQVEESDPPQRMLRLSLKNQELCEAYITKELTFDISSIKTEENQIILNIENYNQPILYKY